MPMRGTSADDHHRTLDEVGCALGVTRERARQIEKAALLKVKAAFLARGYTESDIRDHLQSLADRSWIRFTD